MNLQRRLVYHTIKEVSQNNHGTVTKLLSILKVSRQAYYKGLHRDVTTWEIRDNFLTERVQYWYNQHHQSIGSTKILSNLRKKPTVTEQVTLKQVKRIMIKLGIRCQVRQKKHSRIKQQEQYLQDNVLNQHFSVNQPIQV
ncbi:IS3 family transposase [Lactiplantibacillus plantarum]|uniref:IS3 family transposase n=1 Tax=Lactiplantibacillus plantarum TaxID=1590 RepID=UPI00267D75B9